MTTTPTRSALSSAARLVALALLAALPAGAASNLVPNPRFDTGLAGWIPSLAGSYAWSSADENGAAGSGALRVTAMAADTVVYAWSDCFAVDPEAVLVFGASARVTTDSGFQYPAMAHLEFWDNAGCSGASIDDGVLREDLVPTLGGPRWGAIQGQGEAPPDAVAARLALHAPTFDPPPAEILFDNAFVYAGTRCAVGSHVTCLAGDRFRVAIDWRAPDGATGQATIRAFAAGGDSAWATFFTASNVEAVVKVLDGCAVNDRFWVFAAGLTNVFARISVLDTATGATWTHENPLDEPFAPVQDTAAFATCDHETPR